MWAQIVHFAELWAPVLISVSVSMVVITTVHKLLHRHYKSSPGAHTGVVGPLITFALFGAGLISTILVLPIGDTPRGQLLGLLGLLTTAAVALSSTTYLGNAMAGLMLRAIRNFRPGDSIRVGEHVGRVSVLGILHTEIQTEDRDLTTLPNIYLITHPVTVLRNSGTVVSATVSLGYDIPHQEVETHLLAAATKAGLADPFIQVVELGDYSILYRAAGFLVEIKQLLTTRSNLRKAMLDSLHSADIEIVSPRFINQRNLSPRSSTVPDKVPEPAVVTTEVSPEARIFDKADAAEAQDKIKIEVSRSEKLVADIKEKIDDSAFKEEKLELQTELQVAEKRLSALVECANTEPDET
ncbi:MAG: mechanosensitive ion channel [Kofleriaceae bacterium]|nr:mechanosensitive ion channel [Kofleriaceae bacterium]